MLGNSPQHICIHHNSFTLIWHLIEHACTHTHTQTQARSFKLDNSCEEWWRLFVCGIPNFRHDPDDPCSSPNRFFFCCASPRHPSLVAAISLHSSLCLLTKRTRPSGVKDLNLAASKTGVQFWCHLRCLEHARPPGPAANLRWNLSSSIILKKLPNGLFWFASNGFAKCFVNCINLNFNMRFPLFKPRVSSWQKHLNFRQTQVPQRFTPTVSGHPMNHSS